MLNRFRYLEVSMPLARLLGPALLKEPQFGLDLEADFGVVMSAEQVVPVDNEHQTFHAEVQLQL